MLSETRGDEQLTTTRPAADPGLYNEGLAPVPPNRRTWGVYNYASLWVAMSVCIPTYMLASGLIAGGMNWWQAVGTILLGNLIVLVAHAAQRARRHEIRHSVSGLRAGVVRRARREPARGSARAGGLRMVRHSDLDRRPGDPLHAARSCGPAGVDSVASVWICFFAFWLLNMVVIWRGIETIRFLEGIGAPFMLARRPASAARGSRAKPAASGPSSARRANSTTRRDSSASSFRRSPRWWASGPRSR